MLRTGVAAASIATGIAVAGPGAAQTAKDYPNRPIRMVIPFTAGSATDLIARRVAPKMSENWNQQVVVDNRGGAGGTLATGIVAKAVPDGYTLLVHSIAYAMNAALYTKLPYDPLKDFAYVSQLTVSTSLLVVSPKVGVKSVGELIALAKQKPGQLSFATSGVGSGTHLNAEMFKQSAGVDAVHVPYKGVPEALIDISTGRVQFFLTPLVPALPFIKDGRVVPLAVTTVGRSSVLPDIPAMSETLPGYAFQAWFGVFAPTGTPRPIVEKLSREMARIVVLPDITKQFALQGEEGKPSTPDEFGRFVREEIERYRKIVKTAGIKVE
jgi:tripartite-type tricarboxylate transporter receptor subunit TctC